MNKIIQVNLAGQSVSIDEKAYQSLSSYLHTLENHFAKTEDGDEILQDIEARIAELFFGKIKNGNSFINATDVHEAISLMGTPEDISIDEDQEPKRNRSSYTSRKKLFRDTDDRVLGGVCSGLAAYFNMDTNIMRIAVILLIIFTGIPLFAYFVIWIAIPEATTPEDRSRMHGGNTTVNDIVHNVRNEATNAAQSVKKEVNNVADRLKKNTSLRSSGRSVVSGLEQVIRFFAKIFGAGTLILLVIIGIALSVFLLANAVGGIHLSAGGETVVAPSILTTPTLNWIFSISLLSLILIPIGTLCSSIILFIFNMDIRLNIKAVFLAWLISLAVFIGISIYAVGDLNHQKLREFGEQLGDRGVFGQKYNLEYNQPEAQMGSEREIEEQLDTLITTPTATLSL